MNRRRPDIRRQSAQAVPNALRTTRSTFIARESLDTERIMFTMFNLWQGTLERDTIAKLNENFWSNGYRIT
jgi:hypothetical protein